MQQPTVITKMSEHFKADAENMKEKYGFEFQVVGYRKVSASEMKQAFHIWKSQQRSKTLPKNKTITVQSIIGFDSF